MKLLLNVKENSNIKYCKYQGADEWSAIKTELSIHTHATFAKLMQT